MTAPPAGTPIKAHANWAAWWSASALALVAVLGALRLYTPFHGDQALFLLGARTIDAGGVLYIDFWDVKQPGIFWFFFIAGRVFGFTQEGVRAFELVWMLGFAALLIAALREYVRHPWLAATAAVAILGTYYAFSNEYEIVQIEIVCALPLFASAWLLARSYRSTGGEAMGRFASGGFAAVTVTFKMVLAPIFVVFLIVLIARAHPAKSPRRWRTWLATSLKLLLPFSAGVFAVLLVVVAAFFAQDALEPLLWTTFVYPLAAMLELPAASADRLLSSLQCLPRLLAPWLLFAAVGVAQARRPDEPRLTALMVAWLAAGFIVIVLQKFSWRPYHLLLLYPPVGVLATRGIDVIVGQYAGQSPFLSAKSLSLLLVIPSLAWMVPAMARQTEALHDAFWVRKIGVEGYRRGIDADYDRSADAAAFLSNYRQSESIYVFGIPLYYILSNRRQGVPIFTWAPQALLKRHWTQLNASIAESKPYLIYLDKYNEGDFSKELQPTIEMLHRDYVVEGGDVEGTWYRLANSALGPE